MRSNVSISGPIRILFWGVGERSCVRATFIALVIVFPSIAFGEVWPPAKQATDSVEVATRVLAGAAALDAISRVVGGYADFCEPVSDQAAICRWAIGEDALSWPAFSRELDTGDPLILLCELPRDGSVRRPESCSVHPKRSNRDYFHTYSSRETSKQKERRDLNNAKFASRLLARAKTAFAISTLVGEAPKCYPFADQYYCLWKAHRGTYGHGTLARIIDAKRSQRVKLTCALPSDGKPRSADSCQVRLDHQ